MYTYTKTTMINDEYNKSAVDGEPETYLDRLKKEYVETESRLTKLKAFINKVESDSSWKPNVPLSLYREQYAYMKKYVEVLRDRLKIEDIIEKYDNVEDNSLSPDDDVEFSVNIKCTRDQANRLISLLKWMQGCGSSGHSGTCLVYADGDGGFHPKFNIERFEVTEDYKPTPIKEYLKNDVWDIFVEDMFNLV